MRRTTHPVPVRPPARDLDMLDGVRVVIWALVERDIRFGTRGWQVIALDAGAE